MTKKVTDLPQCNAREPRVPGVDLIDDARDRIELGTEKRKVSRHGDPCFRSREATLDAVPVSRRLKGYPVPLNRIQPFEDRRSLTIDVIHGLETMVVRHYSLLVTLKPLLQHRRRRRRPFQHPLSEKVDVALEDLELSHEVKRVALCLQQRYAWALRERLWFE